MDSLLSVIKLTLFLNGWASVKQIGREGDPQNLLFSILHHHCFKALCAQSASKDKSKRWELWALEWANLIIIATGSAL